MLHVRIQRQTVQGPTRYKADTWRRPGDRQAGYSLVELMVGLAIGLVTTLAIMQVFSQYETQKNVIAYGADAQSSGMLALYFLQRDIQNAGYALPLNNSSDPSPLLCPFNTSISQDGVLLNLTPLQIVDGGTGSDTIHVRYGTSPAGGASMRATGSMAAPALDGALMGCQPNDIILMTQTPASPRCTLARLASLNSDRSIQALTELNTAPTDNPVVDLNGAERVRLSCLGVWNEYRYQISARNELTRSGGNPDSASFPDATAVPVISDVVALQAQYGVASTADPTSTATTAAAYYNQVDQWLDATGTFGPTMTLNNRNRIRAVRVAVVTRDGARQKKMVSQRCLGTTAGLAPVCLWRADSTPSAVDLSADPQWAFYRYRVYETVIPLRNILWNRDAL